MAAGFKGAPHSTWESVKDPDQTSFLDGDREKKAEDWAFAQFDASAMRQTYLTRLRRNVLELHARTGQPVSGDDVRSIFEAYPGVPAVEVLSRNFLPAVFRDGRWRAVGRIKSAVPGSHGREIRTYVASGGAR